MTARRLILAVMGSLSVLVGMLGLMCAPVFAGEAHVFLSSFGSFGYPASVAVDDATGDVYVLDVETGTVSRYTASGEPAEFSALGSNELTGFSFFDTNVNQVAVDNSSKVTKGDIYVTNTFNDAVDVFSPDGTMLGSLVGERPVSGVAVDPLGNLYVSTLALGVKEYTPTANPVTEGDYVASLLGPGLGRNSNVAVDSLGNVYEGQAFEGPVQKFDALQFGSPSPTGTQLTTTARSFAVDPSSDDLYLDLGDRLVEYDSEGVVEGEFGSEQFSDSIGVGVNGADGDVYVADRASKQVYRYTGLVPLADVTLGAPSALTETGATLNATVNPLGIPTTCMVEFGVSTSYGSKVPCSPANLGAGSTPMQVTADLSGLEPNTVYYYRFIVDNSNGPQRVSGKFVSASKPAIDSQGVMSVGTASAALKAQINPNHFDTSFHIEYGADASYGSVAPVPDSKIGSEASDQDVTWSLTDLAPATTYHFRFVARDAFGVVYGADKVFTTYEDNSVTVGSCANAVVRQRQGSSYLPDCRAYELVSPVHKGSANIMTDPTRDQASLDGNAVKYASTIAFGEVQGSEIPGAEYISQRGSEEWSTQAVNPAQKSSPTQEQSSQYVYLTPDLTRGVFYALNPVGATSDNVAQVPNLYLRDDLLSAPPGNYRLLSDSVTPLPYAKPGYEVPDIAFAGASQDMSHIIFESSNDITPEASLLSGQLPKAYEWEAGHERLVGILPDGESVESVVGRGAGGGNDLHTGSPHESAEAVSRNGSHVVFTAPPLVYEGAVGIAGNLYSRVDHMTSVPLNVSERAEPDPNGHQPALFWAATPDGSKVFFTTSEALTDDAVVDPSESKLYMYDFNAPEGKRLTLISVDSEPSDNHSNQDFADAVVGISEDGGYVYFLGKNNLVPNIPRGNFGNELYVWHEGRVKATLTEHVGGDRPLWGEYAVEFNYLLGSDSFRITADGKRIAFVSDDPGTAKQANVDGAPSERGDCSAGEGPDCLEVFTYSYDTNKVVCVSCAPAGDAPMGDSVFAQWREIPILDHLTAYQDRPLSDDGRYIFFESTDKLVPQATNGRWNVYEYDEVTGKVQIISSGACACDSFFVDASADGKNVFFTTRQQLVHADIDDNTDLYDARVEGGIERQNEPLISPCTGESCQLPASNQPNISFPPSATFFGVGNVIAAPSVKAPARKSKPKPKKRKRHKRRRKTSRKSTAVHVSHRARR